MIVSSNGLRGAGISHYAFEAIRALIQANSRHAYLLFVPAALRKEDQDLLVGGARWVHVVRMPKKRVVGWKHASMPLRAYVWRADVFWAPSGEIPLGWRGPSVATVHDVSVFTHPEWFPDGAEQGVSQRFLFPSSMKRATRVVAVSTYTHQELAKLFPETRGKTCVVGEGVDIVNDVRSPTAEEHEQWGLAEDSVLFLGTIEPRKNIERALSAFHQYLQLHPERVPSTRFLLAGAPGWKHEGVLAEIDRINAAWRREVPEGVVRGLGYVTEEQKWVLLAHASCLLFVSLEEGFGLPGLEALACGTPVIASNRGALPEVLGDAALFVDPYDPDAISFALAQVLLVPEAMSGLRKTGFVHVRTKQWRTVAEGLLQVFEEL